MADKTHIETFAEAIVRYDDDQLEKLIAGYTSTMNAHTNAAQKAREHWLVLRDEQKRRMRKA